MKIYNQLTYSERCQIYVLNKTGNTQTAIANTICASQSPISRGLKRNTGLRGYRHQQADNMSTNRRLSTVRTIKMTPDMRFNQLSPNCVRNGVQIEFHAGYGEKKILSSVMSLFTNIFGVTSDLVAHYSNTYDARESVISHVARPMLVEVISRIESALMNDPQSLRRNLV
jgi:IS30 family transposase